LKKNSNKNITLLGVMD